MKQIKIGTKNLIFVKKNYTNNNRLAIQILEVDDEYGGFAPYCFLTVNLPEHQLMENEAFIDVNNCPKEIIDYFLNNGIISIFGRASSGFCSYPLVKFNEDFLKECE